MSVFSNAPEKVRAAKDEFDLHARDVEQAVRELKPLLTREESKRIIAGFEADLPAYESSSERMFGLALQGRPAEALKEFDTSNAAVEALAKSADRLMEIQQELMAEAQKGAFADASKARWIALALTLLSACVAPFVLLAIRRVTLQLRQAATELSDGSEQIASAASQVASSSSTLAQGASEQAASLEETSASAEEITSMTRKNAENSKTAAEMMATVDQHVHEGNRTLEEMVSSMNEINASSDKISKIIKVIDEIAFQTNILALNAAVEAARAGEAGMGFAVVADEVRTLAQRSAQAAKDTAAMIEESIAKSNEGSAKLERVTGVIHSITESATRVKTLIDEVNLGSQEQARGIEQISKAVTQMDGVTQSTAASAEESASASEELSAQAEALKGIVVGLQSLVGKSVSNTVSIPARAAKPVPSASRLPVLARKPVNHKSDPVAADSFPMDDNFVEH